jgi:restriction endonuclease
MSTCQKLLLCISLLVHEHLSRALVHEHVSRACHEQVSSNACHIKHLLPALLATSMNMRSKSGELLQVEDLNTLLNKRQRENKRLRSQLNNIAARPAAGSSLQQLAVQAQLAQSLQQQNDALAAENETLRKRQAADGKSDAAEFASQGSNCSCLSTEALALLAAASAFQVCFDYCHPLHVTCCMMSTNDCTTPTRN